MAFVMFVQYTKITMCYVTWVIQNNRNSVAHSYSLLALYALGAHKQHILIVLSSSQKGQCEGQLTPLA